MKISVALCTYNGSKYLKGQLDSIINQSTSIDEIIICDDYSIDNTWEILNEYKKKHPDIITIISNSESLGTISNFDKAISLCTGEIIFLSDQDDIWFNDKVKRNLNYFKNNPNCELIFSDGLLINSHGTKLGSTLWEKWGFLSEQKKRWTNNFLAFKDLLSNQNRITGATVAFRSSLKVALPVKVPFGYWHDCYLGLHAAGRGTLRFIDDTLIYYRIHEQQQIGLKKIVEQNIVNHSNKFNIDRELFLKDIYKKYPINCLRLQLESSILRFNVLIKRIKRKILINAKKY